MTVFIRKNNVNYYYLLIHVILVFTAHSFYVFIYTQSLELRNNYILQITIRLIIWTVPVLTYLIVSKNNFLDYLKLRRDIMKGVIWGIIIGLSIVFLQAVGYYFLNNYVKINYQLGVGVWLKSIILVGFSEEILFRGFILEKLKENTSFNKANIIQAVLFLLIHFPGWILLNQFVLPDIIRNIGFTFIVAIMLGFILKRTCSLWACIILHSFINFASLSMVIR